MTALTLNSSFASVSVMLFFAPLAVYWGWRERMRVRAGLWGAALALYVVATFMSRA